MMCARVRAPRDRRARPQALPRARLRPPDRRRTAALLAIALAHAPFVLAVGGASGVALGLWLLQVVAARVRPDRRPRQQSLVSRERPRAARSTDTDRYQQPGRGHRARRRRTSPRASRSSRSACGGPGARERGRHVRHASTRGRSASTRSRRSSAGSSRAPSRRRHAGVPDQPAVARHRASTRTPVSLVIQGPDVYELSKLRRRDRRAAPASDPGLRQRAERPRAQQAAARRRRSTATAQPTSACRCATIASTLQILLGGLDLSTFKLGGETYKVMVQLEAGRSAPPRASCSSSTCAASTSELIPLAVASSRVRESIAPRGLPHFDRLRSATLIGDLAAGRARSAASLDRIQALADRRSSATRPGYRLDVLGRVGGLLRVGQRARRSPTCSPSSSSIWCWRRSSRASRHPTVLMIAVALSFTGRARRPSGSPATR